MFYFGFMIIPPFLTPGKIIGIVAPGRKVNPSEIEAAIAFLEASGYKILVGENVFSSAHSYLSGSDEERLSDMQSMLDNDEVSAIISARGGYGTTRFVDKLNFMRFLKNPKWIVGFSDITALHLHVHRLGVESIHAIMPVLFSKAGAGVSVQSLMNLLTGEDVPVEWQHSKDNRRGKSSGPIIGGNLSLIADSLGTLDEPDTSGKILVIEEVEEYKYKIDRMMTQLKRAGKLENLAGLIAGHMTGTLDTQVSFGETVEQIINDKIKDYNYPVSFGFPSGHEQPNIAWRHGAVMTLEVGDSKSLLYKTDA